jgi:putative heme-binding domain-containing protein
LFTGQTAEVVDRLRQLIASPERPDEDRVAAAKRLVRLEDDEGARAAILKAIDVTASPGLSQGLIDALSQSLAPELGEEILSHWEELTPSVRRAAIRVLLRRTPWTVSLLGAVRDRRVARGDLPADQWELVSLRREPQIAGLVKEIKAAEGSSTNPDRQAVLERLLPHAERSGDPSRGAQLFTTLCSSCHRLGGRGAEMAPALDGAGERTRLDLLTDVVDPNRSFESTYQLWMVFTKENEVLSGRLLSESKTTVELLDSGDVRQVVRRDQIDTLRPEGRSAMPEGLIDSLPASDVSALFEYLSQQRK